MEGVAVMRLPGRPCAPSHQRRGWFRPVLEQLEDRLAPALASADVFARFQDTVNDPIAVTQPILADSQALISVPLDRTEAQARAEVNGRLQSRAHVGGVSGVPGVSDPSGS